MKSEIDRNYYRTEFGKLSTPTISDALDSLGIAGGLRGIHQRGSHSDCVGFIFTVKFMLMDKKDFSAADNFIEDVPEGDIVVIDNAGRDFCTVWGSLLSEFSIQQGIAGTVVYGAVRDVTESQHLKYPLFSTHVFMQSGKERVRKEAQNCPININGTLVNNKDLLRADANGCVVVPQSQLDETLRRANHVQKTEKAIANGIRMGKSISLLRQQQGYAKAWENKS